MPHHHFNHQQYLYTNISHAHGAPAHLKQQVFTKLLLNLTCCGLQKQQREETDRDCTLHDGCQENSDSHTDYIYQGRKVKVHREREEVGYRDGQLVEGLRSVCARGVTGVCRATGTLHVQAADSFFFFLAGGCSSGLIISAQELALSSIANSLNSSLTIYIT